MKQRKQKFKGYKQPENMGLLLKWLESQRPKETDQAAMKPLVLAIQASKSQEEKDALYTKLLRENSTFFLNGFIKLCNYKILGRQGYDTAEIVSQGCEQLVLAAEKYSDKANTGFGTYWLYCSSWALLTPRHRGEKATRAKFSLLFRTLKKELAQAANDLEIVDNSQFLQLAFNDPERAEELTEKFRVGRYEEGRRAAAAWVHYVASQGRTLSLEAPIRGQGSDKEPLTVLGSIAAPPDRQKGPSPRDKVEAIAKHLAGRDKFLFLQMASGRTLEQIGQEIGLTREAVRQHFKNRTLPRAKRICQKLEITA